MNSPGNNRELNFARAEQLHLLRMLQLPTLTDRHGRPVKGSTLKHVLRTIDDYGRGRECYPSVEELAHNSGLAPRTIIRAVSILKTVSLLRVRKQLARNGHVHNFYALAWEEMGADQRASDPDRSATQTDRNATGADRSATQTDRYATGGTLTGFKRIGTAPNRAPPAKASDEEQRVGELLRAEGIKYPRAVIDAARERGLDAAGLAAELRDNAAALALDANRGAFDDPAAALASRLKTGHWPTNRRIVTPADLAAQRQRDSARQREREQAAAHQAEAERRQAEQAEQLEQQFAPILDALTPEAREQLAHEALPDPFTIGRYYRRGLSDSFVRTALLKRIQAREQQAEEQALATSQSPAS